MLAGFSNDEHGRGTLQILSINPVAPAASRTSRRGAIAEDLAFLIDGTPQVDHLAVRELRYQGP